MRAVLEHIVRNQPNPWQAIVWAGPGYGAMLGTVLGMEAEIRILFEPHPELHARLERRLRAGSGVRLSPRALWTATGTRPFHLMSDPLRSTLLDPDELRRAWPNLQLLSSVEADLEALETLVDAENIEPGGNSLLILDATGAEGDLLMGTPADVLARFSHIVAGMPVRPLGDGADAEPLPPPVAGFSASPVLEQTAGTRWYLLERMGAEPGLVHLAPRAELARLRQEEADLRSALSEVTHQRDGLQLELDGLRHQLFQGQASLAQAESRVAALEAELAASGRAREEARSGLAQATLRADALEQQLGQLTGERDDARDLVSQLRAQVTEHEQQASQARDECSRLAVERQGQEASLAQLRQQEADVQAAAARAAEHASGLEERLRQQEADAQAAATRAAEQVSSLEAQLREARQTANVASRMQALRENDLQDLQRRYEESRAVQEHQHQLLAKLGERLGIAAAHFHQLADQRVQAAADEPALSLNGEAVPDAGAAGPPMGTPRPRKRRKPGGKT